MAIILQYTKSGTNYSMSFETLAIYGVDQPDTLHKVGVVHELLSGGSSEQILGFRKEPLRITFTPPLSGAETRFIASWFMASSKRIIYGNFVSEGITDEQLISKWLYDLEYGRTFEVQLYDEHLYFDWDDGVTADLMYCKLKVEMSQDATEDTPESFTTNSGKLVLMETGQSFPSFNSSTHKFFIAILSSDGSSAIFPVSGSTVSAGNLTFSTFPASGYSPAADGKLYANIAIYLQAMP